LFDSNMVPEENPEMLDYKLIRCKNSQMKVFESALQTLTLYGII